MNNLHIAGALAWLIVSLHVQVHGGSFWRPFFGFWGVMFGMAVTSRILDIVFP